MSRDFCRIDLSIVDKSMQLFCLKRLKPRTPGSMMGQSHGGALIIDLGGRGIIIELGVRGIGKNWKIIK